MEVQRDVKRIGRPSLLPFVPAAFARYASFAVMPGLVPGIHVFAMLQFSKTWVAGTSPAMTV